MKSKIIATLLLGLLGYQLSAAEGPRLAPSEAVPMIQFEDVPLRDAIKALARQAKLNYLLDPAVLASFAGPDGQSANEPVITARWTNASYRHVLDEVIVSNKLVTVTNPVTTVARITLASQRVKPVSASELGTDTNAPLPLVKMDEVRLRDAIDNLARQANIKCEFNPATEPFLRDTINIRWENVTPKQALVALLDNYDLMMKPKPGTDRILIGLKPEETQ